MTIKIAGNWLPSNFDQEGGSRDWLRKRYGDWGIGSEEPAERARIGRELRDPWQEVSGVERLLMSRRQIIARRVSRSRTDGEAVIGILL